VSANIGIVLILLAAAPLAAQAPARALNWSADDSSRIATLARDGIKEVRRHAVVWAPRDSMSASWVAALADTLDRGVERLRLTMRGPYRWQRIEDNPVTFYLSAGRFIAHGTGYGAVFIPVSRVHERLAPFLHEASHELLAPRPPFYWWEMSDSTAAIRARDSMPLWLFEGIPDYLAQTTAPIVGIHEGDVFTIGGLEKSDSTCAARVRTSPRGTEIIAAVGGNARPAALFTTERAQVAPVFYACGQSLTRHVIDQIGVRATVELMPAIGRGVWRQELERHAARPMEEIRRQWLERIGLAVADSTNDLRAFRRIIDDLQASFERRDAELFVKHFAPDGDFMQAFGRYRGTREGTRDFMERFLSLQSAAFVSREVGTRVRRVGERVAFVEAEFTGEGIRNADGTVQPPRRGQMMLVLEKRAETWQVLSYRYLDIHPGTLRAPTGASPAPARSGTRSREP
jgi:uncharacterized protein (TIGR02246 family)